MYLPTLVRHIQSAYDAPNTTYWTMCGNTIAFRGTEDYADWVVDLDTAKKDYSIRVGTVDIGVGSVHSGFLSRWNMLREGVLDQFGRSQMHNRQWQQIAITGHSLGGAVALFCALELRLSGYDVKLTTFGSPRVGDAEFARFVNLNLLNYERIENFGDPVPWLPTLMRGWRHAGRTVLIGSPLNLIKVPHTKHHALTSYRAAL